MPKTSNIDEIMQNLDSLTLAELLVLRVKVDTLIEEKSSSLSYPLRYFGSYQGVTSISITTKGSDMLGLLQPKIPSSSLKSHIRYALSARNKEYSELKESPVVHYDESSPNQVTSLEEVIDLVDEWMADESDYDEENYSSIESALNRNQALQ